MPEPVEPTQADFDTVSAAYVAAKQALLRAGATRVSDATARWVVEQAWNRAMCRATPPWAYGAMPAQAPWPEPAAVPDVMAGLSPEEQAALTRRLKRTAQDDIAEDDLLGRSGG